MKQNRRVFCQSMFSAGCLLTAAPVLARAPVPPPAAAWRMPDWQPLRQEYGLHQGIPYIARWHYNAVSVALSESGCDITLNGAPWQHFTLADFRCGLAQQHILARTSPQICEQVVQQLQRFGC